PRGRARDPRLSSSSSVLVPTEFDATLRDHGVRKGVTCQGHALAHLHQMLGVFVGSQILDVAIVVLRDVNDRGEALGFALAHDALSRGGAGGWSGGPYAAINSSTV